METPCGGSHNVLALRIQPDEGLSMSITTKLPGAKLKIRPDIRCYGSVEVQVEAAARLIAQRIRQHIDERGKCRLVLAGGNTPRPVYQRLAQTDLAQTIDWARVHIFWGDERCVPPDDAASNYRLANDALLAHVPLVTRHVHRIEVERGSESAARHYAQILGGEPLDVVLLGMGADGHTASLFPHSADLATGERVIAALSPVPPVQRVSISLRQINESHEVYLLVTGADKAERLAEVLRQIDSGAPTLPAARVQPRSGLLFWLCDAAAARPAASQQ
jgi:6-phosphogluconolactonase